MTRFPDPTPGTPADERHQARLARIRQHIAAAKAAIAAATPCAPHRPRTRRKNLRQPKELNR